MTREGMINSVIRKYGCDSERTIDFCQLLEAADEVEKTGNPEVAKLVTKWAYLITMIN